MPLCHRVPTYTFLITRESDKKKLQRDDWVETYELGGVAVYIFAVLINSEQKEREKEKKKKTKMGTVGLAYSENAPQLQAAGHPGWLLRKESQKEHWLRFVCVIRIFRSYISRASCTIHHVFHDRRMPCDGHSLLNPHLLSCCKVEFKQYILYSKNHFNFLFF